MDNEIKTWLYDILSAIDEIESYFLERPKLYAEYQKDTRTKRAVERNIEIIGEAMNRILKHKYPIEVTNAQKIVDTRNRIIHGYDTVSDEHIWSIVINHLQKLKVEVEELLSEK